jgi:uncharacterized protein (DUF1810 family)
MPAVDLGPDTTSPPSRGRRTAANRVWHPSYPDRVTPDDGLISSRARGSRLPPDDVMCSRTMSTSYDLDRFITGQQAVYDGVLDELRAGRKVGHWIWFIFPQIAGLGHSPMSQLYAISSLDEARAYLAHPVLGTRLRECAVIVLATRGRTALEIFGSIDAMKLRSSITLFHRAAPDEPVFGQVLERFFGGIADEATDARLAGQADR